MSKKLVKFKQTHHDFEKKLWMNLPQDLKGNYRSTPAPDSLFKVDKDAPLLNYVIRETCHSSTTKTLWIIQRSRPDLQLSMGHHCARVK